MYLRGKADRGWSRKLIALAIVAGALAVAGCDDSGFSGTTCGEGGGDAGEVFVWPAPGFDRYCEERIAGGTAPCVACGFVFTADSFETTARVTSDALGSQILPDEDTAAAGDINDVDAISSDCADSSDSEAGNLIVDVWKGADTSGDFVCSASFPYVLTVTDAAMPPITVPTGLNWGDEYRLAFVTSEVRNGASSNIASYNTFVTDVANTQPALASLGTTWRVIGSTQTVDARDNTGTNPAVDGVGVPIFLLNDTLLANDNLDLWDGSILVRFEIDEGGSAIQQSFVFTGTSSSGVSRGAYALGAGVDSDVGIGITGMTGTSWVSSGDYFYFLDQPMYALSDVLVVAP